MGSGASVEEPKEDPNLKKLEELEKKLDLIIEKNDFTAKRTDSIPSDSGILGRVLGYDPDVKSKKRSVMEQIRNWHTDY